MTLTPNFLPEKSILSIIDQMETLCHVYEEEREALELFDMNRFANIQYIKVGLVNECEQRISEIQNNQKAMSQLSPVLRERVRETQEKLNELANESARTCKIRSESAKRIQNRLLDAARHVMNKNQNRYNKQGKSSITANTRPVATALNEAI